MNTFWACCLRGQAEHLETSFLEDALRSGEFLEYDRKGDTFHVGEMQNRLIRLLQSIKFHTRISRTAAESKGALANYASKDCSTKTRVHNKDLLQPLAWLEDERHILRELVSVYALLEDKRITFADDQPAAPLLADMFDIPIMEKVTHDDTVQWLTYQLSSEP
jgi:hypothetical protein